MMGKKVQQNRKFWKLTKRKRLSLERFKAGIQWDFFIYIFSFLVVFVVLFISIFDIFRGVEDETKLIARLIPIILLIQLLIITVQTVNQYKGNRISKIGFLPIISVYSKPTSFQVTSKDEEFIIGIKNSGTDAQNVGYDVKINKEVVKSDIDLFILRKDDEKEIFNMSEEDFIKKQIDVRIKFEDMVKSPPYRAIFRKDANSNAFKTLSTGLY